MGRPVGGLRQGSRCPLLLFTKGWGQQQQAEALQAEWLCCQEHHFQSSFPSLSPQQAGSRFPNFTTEHWTFRASQEVSREKLNGRKLGRGSLQCPCSVCHPGSPFRGAGRLEKQRTLTCSVSEEKERNWVSFPKEADSSSTGFVSAWNPCACSMLRNDPYLITGMCAQVYVCAWAWEYVWVCAQEYVWAWAHMCVHVHRSMCVYVHRSMCVYVHWSMCGRVHRHAVARGGQGIGYPETEL